MRFYQIEYTSCRVGHHAGFQISAATSGVHSTVGEADMDEILRLGFYRQPEDAKQAPVAFRAARLESGRQLIQFSRYLGKDDTGREGNFRTRSLVAENPSEALPLWAIDYYEWPDWEHNTKNTDLPFADLEQATGNSFAYTELAQFVREQSRREDWLRTLLATLFLPPVARRVVVCDEKTNNPYWIACISKLLPKAVANSLSLSTFQPDGMGFDLLAAPSHIPLPASAHALCPDSPDPIRRAESAPAVPESGQAYARRVVDLLLHKPDSVPDFLLELEGLIRTAGLETAY